MHVDDQQSANECPLQNVQLPSDEEHQLVNLLGVVTQSGSQGVRLDLLLHDVGRGLFLPFDHLDEQHGLRGVVSEQPALVVLQIFDELF